MLDVQNLTVKFGGLTAVNEVSLRVAEGQIYGLIGPNGAGKSTCFNLITGLIPPTAGQVLLHGRPLTGLKPHQVTGLGLARTFQNIRLFADMSALENVMVGMHRLTRAGVWAGVLGLPSHRREALACRYRAMELLNVVGLGAQAEATAGALSYGQQRRLEIARALATDPQLLCLDEPAAGMNETESRALMVLIRQVRAMGVTVLLIEHDMHVVMNLCDRVAVLNFGRKIADGTPEEIQANPDVIEAYLGRDLDAAD